MTLDSSDSNPIAEGTTKVPEGQQITGQDEKVMSGDISVVSRHTATGKEAETWSYLNIHNMRVASLKTASSMTPSSNASSTGHGRRQCPTAHLKRN